VDRALQQLEALYAEHQRPFGIGLKSLKPGIWEIRAGLGDRILFRRKGDIVELLIVGNHDEIARLLRQL
jgi:putative component of toxin-antitoxin plasmid stabilization module